ncbi:hypothetical protein SDC9_88338 [bioreactor metagenome]|uniref:DUF551 domain-containing protein n=1 Tax=bioreactor metagenome TaxID=1076179 RepID=A0A644ZLB6_9ZZZZ
MRLIDADWVLAALGVFNDRKHGDAHFFNGIASAEEIVEHAPTIATRDWTPCAEGVPTFEDEYAVTIRVDVVNTNIDRRTTRKWVNDCHGNGHWFGGSIFETVLAWQPLPEPYNPDHIRDTTKKVED